MSPEEQSKDDLIGVFKARPPENKLIIKQDPAQEKIGGFALADTAKQKPRQGTVMAVGPAATMCVAGDKVQYAEYSGYEVFIEGEEFIIVKESDLLFIL